MEIIENASLKDLNTLGVKAITRYLANINDKDDITELLEWRMQHDLSSLLLGGGSNLLF